MPKGEFAGDLKLAESRSVTQTGRVQPIIGLLDLTNDCFNHNNVITAQLNDVRVLFSGVLNVIADPNKAKDSDIQRTPLMTTTDKGNTFKLSSPMNLCFLIHHR